MVLGPETMKIVVIGAVAAGLTAAYNLKKGMKDADITILEKQEDISYGACGFPYFIEDLIKKDTDLIARDAARVREDGLDLRTLHEAVKVDFDAKRVHVRNLEKDEVYELSYDKLVIGSGAKSNRIKNLAGIPGVFALNTLKDARSIKTYIETQKPKTAVIVGAGNKGLELLESFTLLGIDTRVVEFMDRILPAYDADVAALLQKALKGEGHKIHLSEGVQSATVHEKTGRVETVVTNKGSYDAELVVETIGVRPNTDFLQGTALEMERGAIVTDMYGLTNIPDVYAGGDCALIYHHVADRMLYLPLGTNSNKIGKLIAGHILGKLPVYKGVQGGALMKTMGYELATNGINEALAKEMGLDYDTVLVRTRNKSGYYPKGSELYIKLLFEQPEGRILGAQIFGSAGAGLRIQGLAVAIYAGLSVRDLEYLDFGYIPPLNSVWDSINVAAGKAVRKLEPR